MAAERRLGEGRPPRRARPGPEEPTDRRRCPRVAPQEPPSASALTVRSVVNGHPREFERTAGRLGLIDRRRGGATLPQTEFFCHEPEYERKTRGTGPAIDARGRRFAAALPLGTGASDCVRTGWASRAGGAGRRPRTWTARRSPRGGGPALGQHAVRHGADRPVLGTASPSACGWRRVRSRRSPRRTARSHPSRTLRGPARQP